MTTDRPTAHNAIAKGLGVVPPDRRRRRESIASGWRKDDRLERMRVLHEQDPEEFDRVFGPRGAIQIGMYEAGKRAAAGHDPDEAA